jgi:hypothetical protein
MLRGKDTLAGRGLGRIDCVTAWSSWRRVDLGRSTRGISSSADACL